MSSDNALRLCQLISIAVIAIELNRDPVQAQGNVSISNPVPTIFFTDTDDTHEWRIVADTNSFDLVEVNTGNIPFMIGAGAPLGSFCLANSGNIGLGTVSPQRLLHLRNNDTPTIRLEQTVGAFPAQTFDVGQNEGGFFTGPAPTKLFCRRELRGGSYRSIRNFVSSWRRFACWGVV